MRLLLVEDDLLLAEGIEVSLKLAGYTVDMLDNGEHALHALDQEDFDLVILDLGLPGLSGYEVLKSARQKGNHTPVLILTARDKVEDKVKGLDLGADDYLLKPFDVEELKARIRALLRRPGGERSPEIKFEAIQLLPQSFQCFFNDKEIKLSPKEFAILHELILHQPRVLSKDKLAELLYGWSDDPDSNALEVHIHHLRKKLGTSIIETIRGVGYRIGNT